MEYYSWILTFHVVSFMSWMAMLFYLPRLFVYHVENIDKKEFVEVVKIQEYKIYKYIITLGHENASVAQKSLNKIKENCNCCS